METQQAESKQYQKTLDAIQLVNAGLPIKQALQVTNFKKDIAPATVSRWKQKYQKLSLTQPKTVKLAHKAILDTLNGETSEITQQKVTKDGQVIEYTEVIAPTVTNKLAAAAMVYDRFEPVKVQAEGHPEGNTYIDLSQIQVNVDCRSPVDKPVDI